MDPNLKASIEKGHLDFALSQLSGPLRAWIHSPESSSAKSDLLRTYKEIKEEPFELKALESDVRRAIQRYHGGNSFYAYRKSTTARKAPGVLKGLDSVSTDIGFVDYVNPELWKEYLIKSSDVLVHWGQDTPLGSSQFKHEKEVILKPGVSIQPLSPEKMSTKAKQAISDLQRFRYSEDMDRLGEATFHGKNGRFTSKNSAHTVTRGGERFKMVRQLRRIGGKAPESEPESSDDVVDTVEEAKAKEAMASFLSTSPGWIQLHDIMGVAFGKEE